MSGIVNFNAQVAPMEHVEKVVRQEQEYSQIKQEATLHGASQTLGRDGEQVQKMEAAGKDRRVDRHASDNKGGGKGAPFAKKERDQGEGDDGNAEAPPQSGPWSGNIVNMKV